MSGRWRAWREVLATYLWDNPLVVRELRRGFRRKWFLWIYTGALAIASIALVLVMFSMSDLREQPLSEVGAQTFLTFLAVEALLVGVLFPSATCTSIVEEKVSQSLDLLVTTRLTPTQIVVGKFLAALVYGLVFVVATLPLVALTVLYGGVTPGQILLSYGALVLSGAAVASYGLLVSSMSATTTRAVLRTFLLLPAVAFLVLGPLIVLELYAVVEPLERGLGGQRELTPHWSTTILLVVAPVAWALVWMALFFMLAVNRLRPLRANRDTPMRLWWVVSGTVLAVLWLAAVAALPPRERLQILFAPALGLPFAMTLAVAAVVVSDPNAPRATERSTGSWWRDLLQPGVRRGARFVLSMTVVGCLVFAVGVLVFEDTSIRSMGLRPGQTIVLWGTLWTFAFVWTLSELSVLFAHGFRGSPNGARAALLIPLVVVSFYPMLFFAREGVQSSGHVVKGYPFSPITVGASLLLRPSSVYDRRLVLFTVSGEELRNQVTELQRAGAGKPRAVLREESEALVARFQGDGIPVHEFSTYLLLGSGVLLTLRNRSRGR